MRGIPLSAIGYVLAMAAAEPLQRMRLVDQGPTIITAQEQRRRDPTAAAVDLFDGVVDVVSDRLRRSSEAERAIMARAAAKRRRRQDLNLTAVATGGLIAA